MNEERWSNLDELQDALEQVAAALQREVQELGAATRWLEAHRHRVSARDQRLVDLAVREFTTALQLVQPAVLHLAPFLGPGRRPFTLRGVPFRSDVD